METGSSLLFDIGLTIVGATFLGFIARALKQPLIIAYVLTGIIMGPSILQLVTEQNTITILAEFGIALLLFMVGLEMDFKRIKDVGKTSIGVGVSQIFFTFVFGYLLSLNMGFSGYAPFYIAFAMTISSTMVVIKLLSDTNEIDTLHGKIVLGTLLAQDIITIVFLAALPTIGSFSLNVLTHSLLTGVGLITFAVLSSRFILPVFMKFASKSTELLFLFSLSWCFLFALITYFIFLNLLVPDSPQFAMNSVSIGAFLAGISLASFPYNVEIVGRIRPLKDFFLTLFFASLGMQVSLGLPVIEHGSVDAFLSSSMLAVSAILKNPMTTQALILSLYALFGSTIILFFITRLMGYSRRTSFMTAISLAQISEFSLILAVQGQALGHINQEVFSLIAAVLLITITISSYFIMYSKTIYRFVSPILALFDELPIGKELEDLPERSKNHVIVVGCHRMGCRIVDSLQRMREHFVVVDYNPETIRVLIKKHIPCIYGDVGDPEILERINLMDAKTVVSTIPDYESNLFLIYETKKQNKHTLIFIVSEDIEHALDLYRAGADYVVVPRIVSGDKAAEILRDIIRDSGRIKRLREEDQSRLEDLNNDELLWKYKPTLLKTMGKKIAGLRQLHDQT